MKVDERQHRVLYRAMIQLGCYMGQTTVSKQVRNVYLHRFKLTVAAQTFRLCPLSQSDAVGAVMLCAMAKRSRPPVPDTCITHYRLMSTTHIPTHQIRSI